MSIKIPLGFKIGGIVLASALLLASAVGVYNETVYSRLLERKFTEKIVNLGKKCAYMSEPHLEKIDLGPEKDRAEAKKILKYILDAAGTKEDMLYTAIVVDGRVIAASAADGKGFKLPQTEPTGRDMLGYYYSIIKGVKGLAYEARFPVARKNKEIGAVLVGFDKTSISGQISAASFNSYLIGAAGAAAMSFLVIGFLYFFVIGPINKISAVAAKISMGEMPEDIRIAGTGDEIEALTRSFHDMSLYVAEIEAIVDGLSNGMITEGFKARSPEDILGTAVERMLKYMGEISALMSEMANGKISGSHSAKSDKDVLGISVAKMYGTLKNFVTGIKSDADIMSSSTELLHQISEQSQATISQLAETVGNISQATAEAAKNSQTASHASMRARDMSKDGSSRMAELMKRMTELSDEISVSTKRMEKLADHSEEIKKMTIVIKAIADETKLLSFNAAIEAARAGEAGRGFVIVAEEIRKLSDLSTEQAAKISSHIKEVRADIAGAIEMVNKEAQSIRESAGLSSETNAIFSEIEKSVNEAADNVNSIAATSEEIAASSEEAASASEEQSASMQEMNASVAELADISRKMKTETDKFSV